MMLQAMKKQKTEGELAEMRKEEEPGAVKHMGTQAQEDQKGDDPKDKKEAKSAKE